MLKRIGRVRSKRWSAKHRYRNSWVCDNDPIDDVMMFYLDYCTSQQMLFDGSVLTFSKDI